MPSIPDNVKWPGNFVSFDVLIDSAFDARRGWLLSETEGGPMITLLRFECKSTNGWHVLTPEAGWAEHDRQFEPKDGALLRITAPMVIGRGGCNVPDSSLEVVDGGKIPGDIHAKETGTVRLLNTAVHGVIDCVTNAAVVE